ncbi:MAG: D-alanyl-D-alanine carboxypeptidase [Eggerthellaceae bacterium]|nr:D-alanyl-D-alanine carboxypeptidase [Eggerthellaceae bacterium]
MHARAIARTLIASLLFALLAFPPFAFAEVRKADVIAGATVEERGLTVADCPSIDASYAALVDADGTVFFAREADQPSQIASITKVMTAIVALDNAPDGLFIAVSEAAAEVGESSANLQQGDVMDLDTALKALLVPSGNDAAVAIAEAVGASMIASDPSLGNDPVGAFVHAMNEKAEQIGCTNTVYENPHGLDDGIYEGNLHSTAYDQAKVAQCAMGYQKIRDIVSGGSTTITVDRGGAKAEVELETTDELLEMYEYTIGVKTGVTDLAGPSFMGAANKDGRELYSVVLGSSDEYQRFADTKELFVWAYDHCIELSLANSDEWATMRSDGQSREVPVVAAAAHGDWIDRTVPATLEDPDAIIQVFDFEGNVSQAVTFDEIHGTVHAGDKVGSIVYKQKNQVIAEQNLVACETVEAPNIIDTLAIGWSRFIGLFTGAPAVAESQVYNVMPIINSNSTNIAQ